MPNHDYLVHFQYLGFRYHGWMIQPDVKTVESMVRKTTAFVLGHNDFKILGASRTDAMVSANHAAFALYVKEPLDTNWLTKVFNANLPADIRVLSIEEVDRTFNILNSPRVKEYLYLFSFGEKPHPFCAPLVTVFPGTLDLHAMERGAALFEGIHDFRAYCAKPRPGARFVREVLQCRIEENTEFTASFFPEKTYALHLHSKGFLRYQVRMIMGQLTRLGRGEIDCDTIKASLSDKANETKMPLIAPASGLFLNRIRFGDEPDNAPQTASKKTP